MTKWIRLTVLLCVLVAETLSASDPAYYVKKKTWNETVRASREALMKLHGSDLLYQARILGEWYAIGPFKSLASNVFAEPFAPEWELDLSKSYDGGKLGWQKKPDLQDGVVNDLGKETHCATYLFRIITAPNDTILPASLGSDDGIKIWLNNKQILGHDADRGCRPDQEHVDLVLRKGENNLLLKINNNEGAYAFYFRIENEGVNTIWKLLKRDFVETKSAHEMSWEAEDSIWVQEWKPGDLSEIARRYVRASMFDTPKELERAQIIAAAVKSPSDLKRVRGLYLRTRETNSTPVVLTPRPSPRPRINGAKVFGARPGNPFLFTIAASGKRPMQFAAEGLPDGLRLNKSTGQITGAVNQRGAYAVVLKAKNDLGSATRQLNIVVGDQIALTPPLGWNSWNCFAEAVNDQKVRSAADAMVKSGLINHGWTYINIDDCWEIKPKSDDPMLMGRQRNDDGMINTNRKFPDMKALSDYIHSKGLKMGIYSSPGPLTCAGYTASYQDRGEGCTTVRLLGNRLPQI